MSRKTAWSIAGKLIVLELCLSTDLNCTNNAMQVHIHMDHGPDKWSREEPHPPDGLTRLYNFSLVICRHPVTGKFLLCQEFANQGFWCPGGAVDPGEMLTVAAKRETLEEAGIDVELKGILSIEYHPIGQDHKHHNLIRLRVIFYAEPSRLGLTQLPKSIPDFESAGACWCTAEEILTRIRLRGSEPKRWVKYLRDGGAVYPLSLLEERSSS
jgi:8-oxo-dGTP pyrophosphatase MutT (NUDIX family)